MHSRVGWLTAFKMNKFKLTLTFSWFQANPSLGFMVVISLKLMRDPVACPCHRHQTGRSSRRTSENRPNLSLNLVVKSRTSLKRAAIDRRRRRRNCQKGHPTKCLTNYSSLSNTSSRNKMTILKYFIILNEFTF